MEPTSDLEKLDVEIVRESISVDCYVCEEILKLPVDAPFDDSDLEIAASGRLAPLLTLWREETVPGYGTAELKGFEEFDQGATTYQRLHRALVVVAAVFGGIAVLTGILQIARYATTPEESNARPVALAYLTVFVIGLVLWFVVSALKNRGYSLHAVAGIAGFSAIIAFSYWWCLTANSEAKGWEIVEIASTALAVLSVVFGLLVAANRHWMLMRFKAERMRSLKYDTLIQAVNKTGTSLQESRSRIKNELWRIYSATETHSYLTTRIKSIAPMDAPCGALDSEEVGDLVKYLDYKCIESQKRYYLRQMRRRERLERWTHDVSPYCFFLSVICVLVHFVSSVIASWGAQGETPLFPFGGTLLVLSIALPVGAAMVRTIRLAGEYGRNANRFKAVARQLVTVQRKLLMKGRHAEKRIDDCHRLLWLGFATRLLDTEQLAWMRLMEEAEWFG